MDLSARQNMIIVAVMFSNLEAQIHVVIFLQARG